MTMKRRDLIIGVVILAVLAVVIYFWQGKGPKLQVPEETPKTTSEKRIEEKFNLTLPEGVERTSLEDVAGVDAIAIATRQFEDKSFTLTILADLPDPAEGFYQAWIQEQDSLEKLSIGRLAVAKGGYLLEFSAAKDYSNYNKVMVSLEKAVDSKMEKPVLEGSF